MPREYTETELLLLIWGLREIFVGHPESDVQSKLLKEFVEEYRRRFGKQPIGI